MTTTARVRQVLPRGLGTAVANILGWGILIGLAPVSDPVPVPSVESAEPSTGMRFDMRYTTDGPTLSALGKEFGSYWDAFPAKLFLLANLPAILVSEGNPTPWGVAPLNVPLLLLVSSTQWFGVGVAWALWRNARNKRRAGSEATA